MIYTQTVQDSCEEITREITRNFAKADPITRDAIQMAAGRSLATIEEKAAFVASVLDCSESQWYRQKDGTRASSLSRACQAAYLAASDQRKLEEAGVDASVIEATIKSVAMWPELEKLTTDELRQELNRTIREKETRANSECDPLDVDALSDDELDEEEMERLRAAHAKQAAASERIMAILDVLKARK